jgi:signal peptidase I
MMAYGANGFIKHYSLMIDPTQHLCVSARLFLLDKDADDYQVGDLVTVDASVGGFAELKLKLKTVTKILAGKPGDRIEFDGLYVTNKTTGFKKYAPVPEQYYTLKKERDLPSEWTLQEGEIFLIGDTIHSLDSRVLGVSYEHALKGKSYVLL